MSAAATTRERPSPLGAGDAAGARLALGAGERWCVAMTGLRKERVAAANLANQGLRSFLPQQLTTRRHARQLRTELAPVFPRYLFVILDLKRSAWRSVNGTLGVQYLIADADRPIAVAPGVVESLIQSTDPSGALVYQVEDVVVGGRVRLLAGAFAGSLGVLQRLDGPSRVQVLFELLGGSVRMSVARDSVAAAG
jgi:transcription antitermination factor NusG